jgi:hypothetical protein
MASRPRHEALRGLVTALLQEGFGAAFSELEHERYLVDNRSDRRVRHSTALFRQEAKREYHRT